MKLPHSTYKIVGVKYYENAHHKLFSDWATELLIVGFDTKNIRNLAGIETTYDDSKLEKLVNGVFNDLQLDCNNEEFTAKCYCYYILNSVIKKKLSLEKGLTKLYKLSLDLDYEQPFMIFFNLYHAYQDFRQYNEPVTYYWNGATPENIETICFDTFTKWFAENPLNFSENESLS